MKPTKKYYWLGFILLFNFPIIINAQSNPMDSITIALYEGDIPNAVATIEEITEKRANGGRFVKNTSVPTLTCYKAPNGNKAVVICPGGGYSGLAIDKEGFLVARVFQEHGIHAFVLKYRTPKDESCKDKSIAPAQDAQQALALAKSKLAEWGSPDVPLGLMGFSAGGHLAAFTSTEYDYDYVTQTKKSVAVPDFSVLIYPVITMEKPYVHMGSRNNLLGKSPSSDKLAQYSAHKRVNKQTPPAFLVHASDDGPVPVKNSLLYYEACIEAGIPAEMHIYKAGGHGFGMFNDQVKDDWMERLLNWLSGIE